MRLRILLALLIGSVMCSALAATSPAPWSGPNVLPPKLEARYQHLTSILRCPVCQNEPIGVSNSQISADMRAIVRQKLLAGKTNHEIEHFMISRYGLFAIYRPPVSTSTLALWFGPAALLLLAGGIVGVAVYRRIRILRTRSSGVESE